MDISSISNSTLVSKKNTTDKIVKKKKHDWTDITQINEIKTDGTSFWLSLIIVST